MRTSIALALLTASGVVGCQTNAVSTAPTTPSAVADPNAGPDDGSNGTADPAPIAATDPHPFDVRDLLGMDRISDHQVAPDGSRIVFVRRVTDLEADSGRTDLWQVPIGGGEATRLTRDPASDFNPRFSADGNTLYFLSTRSGSPQVWSMPAAGGAATQVTTLPLPVGNLTVSPAGDQLAFSTDVFIDCPTLQCTADRLRARDEDKRSGMLFESLFVRHWDSYKDGRRSHLFVMPTAGGKPLDVTAGVDGDVPSKPFGGAEDFAYSPDGAHLVYTVRLAGPSEPWSTNFDLYAVATTGGTPRLLTGDNPAWDAHPGFSPDGKTLAFTSMKRPG